VIDVELLRDAAQIKLDVVRNALNSRTLEIANTTIKKCFAKSGFLTDDASSNDRAVKLMEDEDDWHSLQLLECSLRTT
jgi:hypothetical protein